MSGGQEGKDEDVGVPKDVSAIAGPCQAPGPHSGLSCVGSRRHQVEESEADRKLQLIIAFHHDIGVLPSPGPGPTVLSQQLIEAGATSTIEGVDGRGGIGKGVRVGRVDGDAIKCARADGGCDPAGGSGHTNPQSGSGPPLVVDGVVSGRPQRGPDPEPRRTANPQDRRGRLGQRCEPDAHDVTPFALRQLAKDSSAQVEDSLQYSGAGAGAGVEPVKLEDPGPGE